jgi:flagellar M-ring protein FliF
VLANLPAAMPLVARRTRAWLAPRKAPLALISAALLAAAALALAQSRTSAEVPLYSVALRPAQAIEVERALTLWNEPYSADAAHTQVFVPHARRRDVLLRLTLAGLPHGYVPTTSDVLEESQSAFLPQTAIDDRRRAGIQGDLTASLRRIKNVADASVVIAPAADNGLALDVQRPLPSASVQVVMQYGTALSGAQLAGVRRFVAAGYPGLTPDRVTVMDGSGTLQTGAVSSERGSSRESRLQTSVQTALDAVFGAGAAVVRVNLRTTGTSSDISSTRTVPHGLLDSQSGRERGTERGRTFFKEQSAHHFAYDTIVEKKYAPADAIARMSIAVFLDAGKVSAEQRSAVGDLVRAAAGADLKSGDEIVVRALTFAVASSGGAAPRAASAFDGTGVLRLFVLAVVTMAVIAVGPRVATMYANAPRARAAQAMCSTLQKELPQTAAYVLQTLPRDLRENVLRCYEPEQRARIEGCLARSTHV